MRAKLDELLQLGSKSPNDSFCGAQALQHMDRAVENLLKNRLSPANGMNLLSQMRTVTFHIALSLMLCGMYADRDVRDSLSDIY